jgi:hypothetical protein
MDNQWQPIKTAPKDGTWMLLSEQNFWHVVRWSEEFKAWEDAESFMGPSFKPTHWQPLPEEPVEDE